MSNKKDKVTLSAGTTIKIGDTPIVLTEDADISFAGAENEQNFVGLLVNSGNLEANRKNLKGKYNTFGRPLPDEAPAPSEKLADEPKDSKEFKQAQEENEKREGFLPVAPQDPNNVPQHQRAPELGSPDLADIEKMNNMEQIPAFTGFNPLASKPDGEKGHSGEAPSENASQVEIGSGVDPNGGAYDGKIAAHNTAPNSAIAAAQGKETIGAVPADGGEPVSEGGMTREDSAAAATSRGEQSRKSAEGKPVVDSDDAKQEATEEVAKGSGSAAQKTTTASASKTPAKKSSRKASAKKGK